jgi:hypothetical protein
MEDAANPKETSNYSARNFGHGDRAKIEGFNFAAFFGVCDFDGLIPPSLRAGG